MPLISQCGGSTAWLCQAWGETNWPDARIVTTRDEVRQFLIDEWFGDGTDEMLPEAMAEFDAFDWRDRCPLKWEFEIGGVCIELINLPTKQGAFP